MVETALEGAERPNRRYRNMNMAFTYGYKFSLQDLDDPFLELRVVDKLNIKMVQKEKEEMLRKLKLSLNLQKTSFEEKIVK